jgi:hypothetical protein
MNKETFDLFGKIVKPLNRPPALEIPGVNTLQDLAQLLYDRFGTDHRGNRRIQLRGAVDDFGPADWERRYFHAVVKKYCTKGFNDIGYRYSDADTYRKLKRMFCDPMPDGSEPSTSRYSEERYHKFVEQCIQFAAEFLSIVIAPPTGKTAHLFPTEERQNH